MTLSKWVQEQYDDIEKRMKQIDEYYLVKLISEYMGYSCVSDYVVSVVRMEAQHYKRDLRFERWLKQRNIVIEK